VTLVAGTIASCPKDSRAYYTKLAITSTDASQAVHESQTLPVCPTIAASSSSAPSTTSQPSSDISQTFHRDYVDGCRKTQSRAGCECIFTQLTQNQGIDSEEKLKQLSERVVTATRTGDRSAFPSEFVASVKACKSLIRPTG
jgi:hypothetical protein